MTALTELARRCPKLLIGLAVLVYPLTVWLARGQFDTRQWLVGLLWLFALRSLATAWLLRRHVAKQLLLAVALGLAGAILLYQSIEIHATWFRLYPALLDLLVTAAFFGSLFTARPLVERFARVIYPDLPPAGVRYTRRVTQVWVVVMGLVTLVSLGTALSGSLAAWSLFNGLIAYIVIGLTFAGEYAVRCRVKQQWFQSS